MITRELLAQLKDYGFHLISIKDKKPNKPESYNGSGDWSWKKDKDGNYITYSNKELLKYELGVNHEACSVVDADFDCDESPKFQHLLPPTFTVGSMRNGTEQIRKKIYFVEEGIETEHKSFPTNRNVKSEDGTVIENLAHTQSWIAGGNRFIINNVKPKTLNAAEYKQLKRTIRKIYALSMLTRLYPKKDTFRDSFSLALAGCLHHETDYSDTEKKEFVTELCKAAGDKALKKRLEKLPRVKENIEKGEKKIWKTKELSELLGRPGKEGGLDFIDAIRDETKEKPNVQPDVQKEYPLINASMVIKYPPTRFIMEPIFTERSCNQIYGEPESGKTLVGMALGINMSSGHDCVGFKSIKPVPVGYVEGELPGTEFISRKDTIVSGLLERGLDFNSKWFFYLTRDDLEMHGFKYGFDPIAVSRNLSEKDAIDYGVQGRKFIENWVERIEKQTGVKPFFFLDNITALADIDENRAQDWTPLIQWTTHMKSKGYSNCFDHHANKHTGTSSGSGAKERLLDTSIKFEKLMPDQRFEMPGNKNLQCRVSFTKSRNFGGGQWDKPFLLTMSEDGKFTKYPNLVKDDFTIIDLWKQKISVKEMEHDPRLKIKSGTIYKHITKLKKWEIIK